MPGKKYTVQDTQTGKQITFEWNGTSPPTDADYEEVFAQARSISTPQTAMDILTEPGRMAESAIGEMSQGNRGLGALRLGRAGLAAIPSLFGAASQGARDLADSFSTPEPSLQNVGAHALYGVSKTIDAPGHLIGGISDFIVGTSHLLGDPIDEALGTTFESPTAKEFQKLSDESVPYAVAPMVPKMGAAVIKAGRAMIPESLPMRLQQSALKPSLSNIELANKQVRTSLDLRATVNEKTVRKIAKRTDELEGVVGSAIERNVEVRVPVRELTAGLDKVKKGQEATHLGEKAVADVEAVRSMIERHPHVSEGTLPLKTVQEIKKSLYRANNNKYAPGAEVPLKSESTVFAEKAVAHAAMEAINKRVPSVRAANAELSKLYTVKDPMLRAVERSQSKDVLPFGPFLGASAAGTLAGVVTGDFTIGGSVAVGKLVLDNPKVKSRIAVGLEKVRTSGKPKPKKYSAYNKSRKSLAIPISPRHKDDK